MKFELNRPENYSDEALLNEIRRVAISVEKPLTRTKFDKNSKYRASTIEKRFGGWLKSLERAGLDKGYWHTENQKITSDEIVNELKYVAKILNSTSFSRRDFAAESKISPYVFKGDNSFNNLMKVAGLDIPLVSRKYSDIERLENLLNVWTFYGRQPNYDEMKSEPSVIGPKAYVTRWGSWTKALKVFIEKLNMDLSDEGKERDTEDAKPIKQDKKITTTEDRREIPIGLRYDILKRDNFCCVLCGAIPKIHNVKLEVDHIIAWTNGGKTSRGNLRTLCNKCNCGKSDKAE